MAEIKLVPKGKIGITVEAEVIRPDAFLGLSKEEIEKLQVWQGPRETPLSEFFEVEVRPGETPEETKIIIDGDVSRVKRIGQGMKAGKIEILGNVGMHLGAEMAGGIIAIFGEIKQFCPGFIDAGHEDNPKVGELQLEGKFNKFTGDFALSKNPKGLLYCREV